MSGGLVPAPSKMENVSVEGFVLFKNVGYDDCVRRAAATDAMATPPVRPMSRITLRYAPTRRTNVARNRYLAISNV